jgi:hypothetical protein
MAKFSGEERETQKDVNEKSLKDMSMSIRLRDRKTGEEYNLEDDEVVAVRFKERKGNTFYRFKGKNGIYISIPKGKLPKFIVVQECDTPVW